MALSAKIISTNYVTPLKTLYLKGFFFWFVYYTYTIRFQTNKFVYFLLCFLFYFPDRYIRFKDKSFYIIERLNWFISLL